METQCVDMSPFCSQSNNGCARGRKDDLANVSMCHRFFPQYIMYIHCNGRTSGHKARPGNQLNTCFLWGFWGFSPIKKLICRSESSHGLNAALYKNIPFFT